MLRGDDACAHWTTPRPAPARDFTLMFDPHEGTSLVGQTGDTRTPADRRYLSDDGGHAWRAALCPGALNSVCPAFSADNVFGAGAAYGFVDDGVYRFVVGGPAQSRLAISNRLPARTSDILAVSAGARAGDPEALLAGVHTLRFRHSSSAMTTSFFGDDDLREQRGVPRRVVALGRCRSIRGGIPIARTTWP